MSGRRIVTGAGPDGRSRIVSCGEPPRSFRFRPPKGGVDSHSLKGSPAVDGFASPQPGEVVTAELWATSPADEPGGYDPTLSDEGFDVETAPGATKWRLVAMGPGWQAPMHRTQTVDYDLVISGELELVLEEETLMLGPGDMVMLPGTAHGWKAGPHGAVLAVSMLGMSNADQADRREEEAR